MAQFARPDSDVTVAGWTQNTGSSKWEAMDETVADDATTYNGSATSPDGTQPLEVGLSNVTDPQASTGHIVRARHRKSASAGKTITGELRLYQGTTQIATLTGQVAPSDGTWATVTLTLSAAEADSITDYTDLRVRWIPVTSGSGAGRSSHISWAELEVPNSGPAAFLIDAQPGSFVLTGVADSQVADRMVNSAPGAFTLTGLAATVVAGRVTSADPGSYALSGAASSLIAARVLDATPGTFTFTGIAATLLHSAGATDYPLDAQPGTFTLTGTLASVVAGRMVLASPGSYVLTGVLVENPTTRVMSAIPGEFILTGIAAGLVHTVPGSPTSHNRTTLGVGT